MNPHLEAVRRETGLPLSEDRECPGCGGEMRLEFSSHDRWAQGATGALCGHDFEARFVCPRCSRAEFFEVEVEGRKGSM